MPIFPAAIFIACCFFRRNARTTYYRNNPMEYGTHLKVFNILYATASTHKTLEKKNNA